MGAWQRMLGAALVASATAGCASPVVKYTPVSSADDEGLTKFQLAESMINFSFAKNAAGTPTGDVAIASVAVPYGDKKYGIGGTGFWQNWGVVTLVNASFRGDSDLIQQLTVAVTDERVQAIQALGSIAGTIGAMVALELEPSPGKPTLPTGISITKFLASIPAGCQTSKAGRDGPINCTGLALDGTTSFTADLSLTAVPVDALPASKMDTAFYSSNFYYSACRQLTITLKPTSGTNPPTAATVAVADPLYLESLQIPAKGNITVAPSCGANSAAQDPNLPTAIDYINTLATQAKAVQQTLDGNNSSGVSKKK